MVPHSSFFGRVRQFRATRFQLVSAAALGAALISGCGGGGTITPGPLYHGNTSVALMASSTANDQLVQFPLSLSSLTLTSDTGATAALFSTPVSAEYIHLNGNLEPLVEVSIPQGIYTSATATYNGSAPVCLGQSTSGGLLIDGALGDTTKPTVTVNMPKPIVITGTAMALDLDLQVSASAPFTGACAQNLSVPIAPVFKLTTLTIAAQPTNPTNGKALGLVGTVTSVDTTGSGFTATAPIGYWNGDAPVWQISTSSSTVFQGINSVSGLANGMPVDMDLALQPDGSLMATRVAVYNTDATNAAFAVGQIMMPGYPGPSVDGFTNQQSGGLTSMSDVFNYANAASQISGQFTNLQGLPFPATFDAASAFGGENVLVTSNATPIDGGIRPLPLPIATMTLMPQTINGTVSAISTTGGFTTYTVTLAPYDLAPQLAAQPGQQPTLTSPNTVVVYADTNTQKLNANSLSVGGVFRFYGLLFDDSGTVRMDCAQINDGVPE